MAMKIMLMKITTAYTLHTIPGIHSNIPVLVDPWRLAALTNYFISQLKAKSKITVHNRFKTLRFSSVNKNLVRLTSLGHINLSKAC